MTHDDLDMDMIDEEQVSLTDINRLMADNSSLRDRIMAKARARKTNPFTPSPWFRPFPEHMGIEVIGTVSRYFSFTSRYGPVEAVTLTLVDPVTLAEGDLVAGDTLNLLLTGAMGHNFRETSPQIGDVVLIEYLGMSEISEGQRAHAWNYSHVPQSELTE